MAQDHCHGGDDGEAATHEHAGHEHHAEHGAHMEHGEHAGHEHHMHGGHAHHHAMMVADFRRRFWISTIVTIPVLALSPMVQKAFGLQWIRFPGDSYVLLALATFIFVYGGYPFLKGLVQEVGRRLPGMMTLIAVAITAAYVYSAAVVLGLHGKVFFWELATLIDIMLLGHWIEMRSVMGASRALEGLAKLMPDDAHRLKADGSVEDVPVSELRQGDQVLIKPGERVPADGRIVEGRSSLNESMLTGESRPVEKGEGNEVIGGSINGEGGLQVAIEKTGEETYLSQVIKLVEAAQESKSRSQDLANRAALWLTIVALSVGVVTLAIWLIAQRGFEFALERMITVMVITCPHALGLAVPLVVAVSTAIAAGRGLLIRNRSAFERSRKLDAVVFDKTGTLTEGRFGVANVTALNGLDENTVLRLAAAVEARSEHPIAQGVLQGAQERGLQVPAATDFQGIAGRGAQGHVEGRDIKVVSQGYLQEHGIEVDPSLTSDVTGPGQTLAYVLSDGTLLGAIGLADVVRPESREAIQRLHALGIRAMMLTGDNDEVARWVARDLGLDEYFAGVLPHEKAEKIKEIQARGLTVGMVGDGVNDAPALVQADVGIAIGAGTDVAIESADIVLVKNDPRAVLDMLGLAQATWRKMVQNLAWATGYNVIAIPLAAGLLYGLGILLSPAAGAVLMSLSTVIVAINARLLRLPASARAPRPVSS
jgi:Cu2+-exporting ATPase